MGFYIYVYCLFICNWFESWRNRCGFWHVLKGKCRPIFFIFFFAGKCKIQFVFFDDFAFLGFLCFGRKCRPKCGFLVVLQGFGQLFLFLSGVFFISAKKCKKIKKKKKPMKTQMAVTPKAQRHWTVRCMFAWFPAREISKYRGFVIFFFLDFRFLATKCRIRKPGRNAEALLLPTDPKFPSEIQLSGKKKKTSD